jgi:hypothetical protein
LILLRNRNVLDNTKYAPWSLILYESN